MQNLKVKTLVLILLGVMVVGGLGYGGYRLLTKEKPEENGSTNQSTQSATTQYTWQTYHNDEFGFSFEYPEEWSMYDFQPDIPDPYSDHPMATSLSSPMPSSHIVNFRIYTDQPEFGSKENLVKKYLCQIGFTPDGKSEIGKQPNAIVGGNKAYVSKVKNSVPGGFDACLQNGNTVIELQYMMHQEQTEEVRQNGLLVFKHVLESFKFNGVESKSVLPDF